MISTTNKKLIPKSNFIDFNKWTNYFFIGFAFSIPISKALISLFMVLMLISWILEKDFYTKLTIIKNDKLSLVVLSLIGYSMISLLWSEHLLYALDFIARKYWHFLIIPIILTSFKTKYIKYVLNAFLLSMFISELVSYGIFFEIITYNNIPSTDPSPFMNHIQYSVFLSFALIIIIAKLFNEQNIKWKVFYLFYFITGVSNLFINGGRTGQVTFILTLLIMAFLYFRHSYKIMAMSLLTIILTLGIAYNFSPNFKHRADLIKTDIEVMYYDHNFQGSLGQRISLWVIGTATFFENPLLGTGIGSEMDKASEYAEKFNVIYYNKSDYHNVVIQYAVQLGIVGLMIPLVLFYILFSLKFETYQFKLLATSFSIIFFLHSMGDFSFHGLHPLVFLCTFAALFNAISYNENIETKLL